MSDHDPILTRRHLPSAIWFLPLLAAIIAGWLVYKNYDNKGVLIEVIFDSAAGLEAKKTKVFYRGLPAGVVKELKIDDDLRRIKALIEMVPQTEKTLTENAQFWLVEPQVSLSGVRGLETLLSGSYISYQPGLEGEPKRAFEALDQPPPPIKNSDGLYITLTADNARSVYQGAKVYFRDIEVGEVLSHALSSDGKKVLIETYIEPRFTYLIKENTRFWNASGIKVKADFSKIDIQIGSLASIIAGGIHFSTPDESSPEANNSQILPLYDDYEAAQDGIEITLRFPGATELREGATVQSRGIQIGRVKQVTLTDDFKHLDSILLIDPRAQDLLKEGSQFWLQKPEISLENLGNISSLLRGSHIELEAGQGADKRSYNALEIAPIKRQLSMGKAIELRTEQLGSISKGAPVLYRQLPVGEVINYELDGEGKQVIIHAAIEQRYSHLIKNNSRFWNASGIDLTANIDGLELRTESAAALLRGGIAFFNPPQTSKTKKSTSVYQLYRDYHQASEKGILTDKRFQKALKIRLHSKSSGALSAGDPILYKQIPVGEIAQTVLNKDGNSVTIYAFIDPTYDHLINEGSRFWIASGIKADISLKQLTIRSESIKTLVQGGIAFETEHVGKAIKPNHLFALYPDHTTSLQQPLGIQITFPAGKSVQPNTDLRFKGQIIGKVTKVAVINEGNELLVDLNLFRDGHFLARKRSLFWVVEPAIRLSGVDHPEGILTGNFIEASSGEGPATFSFKGVTKAPAFENKEGLNLIVHAPTLGSLFKGSPIFYRQVPVGSVTGYDLTRNGKNVEIFINIKPEYALFVRKNSEFRNASGVRIDFSLFGGIDFRADSLETMIGGGLNFTSPPESQPASSGEIFVIDEM
ncbi:PqiB family protein [Neptunomonas japonica]|uniref:Paraquat-inducible protein B n=1 Tax=Neptunomonas japonica JAMM 1380 TaxID=1441457 RepID=A0A7R6PK38_9GAMM|nr:MlaD family protein [Neptunomonas japonica]BBB31058.1 paraquat-inducible protein B [Neptunomonas japonica JAMM 1380]